MQKKFLFQDINRDCIGAFSKVHIHLRMVFVKYVKRLVMRLIIFDLSNGFSFLLRGKLLVFVPIRHLLESRHISLRSCADLTEILRKIFFFPLSKSCYEIRSFVKIPVSSEWFLIHIIGVGSTNNQLDDQINEDWLLVSALIRCQFLVILDRLS